MSVKLKELVELIKSCNTEQEERKVISKESIEIHKSLKEKDDIQSKHRDITKLIYIHLLGYSTEFGLVECIKSLQSKSYAVKRLAYLGIKLLETDENKEILILATGSMTRDLYDINPFVVSLSLSSISSLSRDFILRDFSVKVAEMLLHNNTDVKKKAALCSIVILKNNRDLIDDFIPNINKLLLNERNHSVLLTGFNLIIEICKIDSSKIKDFKKMVPQLINILKRLVSSKYIEEYDVSGVTDPFLQVKILSLLGVLGCCDNDLEKLLAEIITNTDCSRGNGGNAILYECYKTIISNQSSNQQLKLMGHNIIRRFLLNKDNNIRYIALNILSQCQTDVSRHKNAIMECIKDQDITIQCKALKIIDNIIHESNVKSIVKEMIDTLFTISIGSPKEFQKELVIKICTITEKYSVINKVWYLDTMQTLLSVDVDGVPENVSRDIIRLISLSPELGSYAIRKFYKAMVNDITKQYQTQIALWCIGYVLVSAENQLSVTERDILDVIESIINDPSTTQMTLKYTFTTLNRLSTSFSESSSINHIKSMINQLNFIKQSMDNIKLNDGPLFDNLLIPISSNEISFENLDISKQSISMMVFEKYGIEISYYFTKPKLYDLSFTDINISVYNTSKYAVTSFTIQVAALKYLNIKLLPASSETILPNQNMNQNLLVINPCYQIQKPIVLKLKIQFLMNAIYFNEIIQTQLPLDFY